MIRQIAEALEHVGLTLQPGLCISFRGSCPTPLFEFNHPDIAKPFQYLAKCYADAAVSKRQDISKCSAIFDLDFSSMFLRKSRLSVESSIPVRVFFESVQVGRNLTNDRLYRAELVASPKCRLCDCKKLGSILFTSAQGLKLPFRALQITEQTFHVWLARTPEDSRPATPSDIDHWGYI